jgi:hypothetical protein
MNNTKIRVNGEKWLVTVISAKEMRKVTGEKGIAGYCSHPDKTIYVDQDCLTYEVIAHELHHAYFWDLHLEDTESISISDLREIVADLFASKGARMVGQARRIEKDLRGEE